MENNENIEITPTEEVPGGEGENESTLSNNETQVTEDETELTDTESESDPVETDTEALPDTEGTVSGGDSLGDSQAGIVGDVIEVVLSAEQTELFEQNNELLTQLVEAQTQTIVDKPLAQYSPTEGMLLILLVFVLGLVLGKVIGGIIPCKQ